MVLLKTLVPKLLFESAPQKSPPLARKSWALGLSRLQLGTKFPLASVHDRDTLIGMRDVGLPSG